MGNALLQTQQQLAIHLANSVMTNTPLSAVQQKSVEQMHQLLQLNNTMYPVQPPRSAKTHRAEMGFNQTKEYLIGWAGGNQDVLIRNEHLFSKLLSSDHDTKSKRSYVKHALDAFCERNMQFQLLNHIELHDTIVAVEFKATPLVFKKHKKAWELQLFSQ